MTGRKKLVILSSITVISVVLLVSLVQFIWRPAEQPPGSMVEDASATNLGFSYLQITPGVAAYYNLEVESGALVTDVVAHGPADEAGLQVGDIIRSFNGAQVADNATLLGMIMSCSLEHTIEMETRRGETASTVRFLHTNR